MNDGAKTVCADELKPGRCLVYSLGSRGDFAFEEDVIRRFNCTVVTLDCVRSRTIVNPGPRHPAFAAYSPFSLPELRPRWLCGRPLNGTRFECLLA